MSDLCFSNCKLNPLTPKLLIHLCLMLNLLHQPCHFIYWFEDIMQDNLEIYYALQKQLFITIVFMVSVSRFCFAKWSIIDQNANILCKYGWFEPNGISVNGIFLNKLNIILYWFSYDIRMPENIMLLFVSSSNIIYLQVNDENNIIRK